MNTIGKQIESLIIDNVPKSLDLMLPVSQDAELKSLLERILAEVRENAQKLRAIRIQLYELENKRNKDYYDYYNHKK